MIRKASAVWEGGLKNGKGVVSTESGVLAKTPYSFSTRFEAVKGTNPEELIAAAHAACFSMALSAELGKANIEPQSLSTSADLTLEKLDSGWTVTQINLNLEAKVPGVDPAAFEKAAQGAKENCPISKLLKAAKITLQTRLV